MATKAERLQSAWHQFDSDKDHKPTGTRQAVEWAVQQGLIELPDVDPYDVLAEQMSQALRAEMATDSKGRRYRVNHAVRITKGGVQYTFWGVMGFASHEHMEKAFAWRREQIVGDNVQLATDVEVYNDLVKGKHPPIQIVMDYTDDVAERQIMRMPPKKAEVA